MAIDNLTPVRRPRVRFSSEVMFIVSVIFCVCLSAIYLSRYFMIRGLMAREQELVTRVTELERENRGLKRHLDNLSTPAGVEHLARERLGLVKPNEIVVVPMYPASAPPQIGSPRVASSSLGVGPRRGPP